MYNRTCIHTLDTCTYIIYYVTCSTCEASCVPSTGRCVLCEASCTMCVPSVLHVYIYCVQVYITFYAYSTAGLSAQLIFDAPLENLNNVDAQL